MSYIDFMLTFRKVLKALNDAKVQYIVAGGVAVNLHGFIRVTGDLDLLVLLKKSNLKKLDMVMKKLGYVERQPISAVDLAIGKKVEEWQKTKNFKAFTYVPEGEYPLQVDILIEDSLRYGAINKKKMVQSSRGLKIPIVDIETLIAMKSKAGRINDLKDLDALLRMRDYGKKKN